MIRANQRNIFPSLAIRGSNPIAYFDALKARIASLDWPMGLRHGERVIHAAGLLTLHLKNPRAASYRFFILLPIGIRAHSKLNRILGGTMRINLLLVAVVLVGLVLDLNRWPALAGEGVEVTLDETLDYRFPACAAVVDVTKPPYSAKGDGKSDDTAAIQRALTDAMGQHKIVYFPNGIYVVSATLAWSNKNSGNQNAWGFNWIQGQNSVKTVIRLADGTFPDPKAPAAIMWCGGFGSADWFHNYIQDMTFDIGRGNPGAVGLQFYSNNTGAIRNIAIVSPDGDGVAGLDLAHRDMNGPLLARNVVVRGFDIGIRTGNAVNSQTFDRINLRGQKKAGFENTGQAVAIRMLHSENSVPAVCTYGTLSLQDAELIGKADAKNLPAVVNFNGGRIALRDVNTVNYSRAVADVATPDFAAALRVTGEDKPGSLGPKVAEYFSHTSTSPYGGPRQSLRMAVEEPPEMPWDDLSDWAVVDRFGADPTGNKDSAAAIQRAIDSGASTIFFPGSYALKSAVTLRGKARRLLGTGNWIDYTRQSKVDFIISDGDPRTVVIEHFAPINGGIEVRTDRTVVIRSVESHPITLAGKGQVFLEDVATSNLQVTAGQRVWARQLNIENEGDHLTNDGGDVWILGYKTERGGTLLHTRGGGRSEVFGTFSYTTTAGKLAPMFVTTDSHVFAFFSEVCYTGDPFATLVRETRGGIVREVKRGEGLVAPYIGLPAQASR